MHLYLKLRDIDTLDVTLQKAYFHTLLENKCQFHQNKIILQGYSEQVVKTGINKGRIYVIAHYKSENNENCDLVSDKIIENKLNSHCIIFAVLA